jgi:catechol 2,3-dioxygenase-like lactoylglutathione lyase family enzyme
MHHVGVVVDDIDAAVEFFAALGLEAGGKSEVREEWAGRVVGIDDMSVDAVMVEAPGGKGRLELIKFHSPPIAGEETPLPANVRGIRHLAFVVDDVHAAVAEVEAHGGGLVGEIVDYSNAYRLCYVRGPEGIIVELAQELG